MLPTKIKAKDLKLADVIKCIRSEDSPFSTAIVTKVDDKQVTLFRPYGTCEDFSCTSGVICYTGVETYSIWKDETEYLVYERKDLK